MDMQGSRQLAVTQSQAWNALNDPAVLKACIPGCDKVEATGDNQYAIGLAVKIGPVAAKFNGKITLSDINAPHSYNIAFDGQGGVAGFGKGDSTVKLVPNDAGCEMRYTVHATVGGKVAQLGQRLIDGAAKGMAEDFFKRFDAEMARQYPAAYAEAAAAKADATQGAAPPAGARIPVWVWAAGAAALALAVYLLR